MDELITAPSDIWQKAKTEIQNSVTRDLYSSWFEQLELVGGDAEKLVLGAHGEFAAIWIRDNFTDILLTHASLAAGRNMSVEIVSTDTCLGAQPQSGECSAESARAPVRAAARISGKIPPLASIKPCNTFETFVVGESNRFAHAAALFWRFWAAVRASSWACICCTASLAWAASSGLAAYLPPLIRPRTQASY